MWSPGKSQNEYTPHVFLAAEGALQRKGLPAPAVERLAAEAQAALAAGPWSVMNKASAAPSGDKHDYISLRTYASDGVIDPDVALYDRLQLNAFAEAVDALCAAWAITRERRYAQQAAQLLRTWFLAPSTRMNPHLEYGQFVPGATRGRATGIIDTHSLVLVPQAIALLRDARVLAAAELAGLRRWFAAYLRWLLQSDLGVGEALAENNHGTWYRVQVAAFAAFAGRRDLARAACIFSAPLLNGQVGPDGGLPLEQRRTRGLFYSLFNVQGWCMLSLIASKLGLAQWGPTTPLGRRVQQAMDYLLPYLTGRPWPHQQIDEMDHRRSATALCFAAAWWQDPRYAEAITQLPPGTHDIRGRLLYNITAAPEAPVRRPPAA